MLLNAALKLLLLSNAERYDIIKRDELSLGIHAHEGPELCQLRTTQAAHACTQQAQKAEHNRYTAAVCVCVSAVQHMCCLCAPDMQLLINCQR